MPFPHFGALELGIIALIVMMIFGVGKLPEIGGSLGKGIHKFRISLGVRLLGQRGL